MQRDASTSFPNVEAWARHYVLTSELAVKIAPPPPPKEWHAAPTAERLTEPGRPPELNRPLKRKRTSSVHSLRDAEARARLLHSFWHHELQAAELMCWALLAFADAELSFRKGLLGICQDEIRHMGLYQRHIESLGFGLASFGVRDWFWRRVPSVRDKVAFVALMGMGFEAANLEHAQNFADLFSAVGDETGAEIQRRIAEEELPHVAFGTHWFACWTAGCDFAEWVRHLPPPISPWVLRGKPLASAARQRAGMTAQFIAELAAYEPQPRGPGASGDRDAP